MKKKVCSIFQFIIVLITCFIFWKGFMRSSDFKWTVEQTKYWDAIIETLIIFWSVLMIVFMNVEKKIKIVCLVCDVLLFSFLHSFIWALIFGTVYMFGVYLLGDVILKKSRNISDSNKHDFDLNFLFGFSFIIVLVAMLSLIGYGTPQKLRIIFSVGFIILIILEKEQICKLLNKTKEALKSDKKTENNTIIKVFVSLAITMFIVIICRANQCTDYDSLWYGLRAEYVLAPFRGIYDKVILMACVHTYPKGFEIFTLLFSGLNSFSFIVSINVVFFIMLIRILLKIGDECNISKNGKIVLGLLVLLTPSITNLVISAKPDIASIYFQCIGILYAIRTIKYKSEENFVISVCALGLTFAIKSTSILFSALLFVILIVYRIRTKIKFSLSPYTISILPLVGLGCVFARTIYLTGLPMTSLIVSLLQNLGFKIKYPYTLPSSRVTSLSDLFQDGLIFKRIVRLIKLFFYPNTSDLVTTERTWWGVLFSLVWIITMLVIFSRPKEKLKEIKKWNENSYLLVTLIICSAFSIGTMLILDMPDGNYYMLMQVMTYVYFVMEFGNRINTRYVITYFPILICNVFLSIAISCSWCVGFTDIDINNYGYYNHTKLYKQTVAENYGLKDIYNYLSENELRHILVLSDIEDEVFVLPGIIENYAHQSEWASETMNSAQEFEKFMEYVDMDNLLVESSWLENHMEIQQIITQLIEENRIQVEWNDERFVLYSVN